MPLSLDQFVRRLAESRLLTEADVQALVAALSEGERPQEGQELARLLVRVKKLTAYQAQEVYEGAGKNLVLGNYVILDKLGQGGMGMVLKAQHKRMDRLVALKVLSPAVTKTPEATRRFQREVKAAAKLTHPNVVTAYDADEAAGTHFLVMEYVGGADLSSLVRGKGALGVEQALNYVLQTARGLHYAHGKGVIHRDIKPSNLLLDQEGIVKILDMGLARLDSEGVPDDLTDTGQMMGTVDYMAPEQAMDTKHADARADIYSLGATLWYLFTAQPLYKAETTVKRLMAHQQAPIPSLRAACPAVSADLEAAFVRMVAKEPAARFQTMGEVIEALEACRGGAHVAGPSSRLAHEPAEDSKLNAFLRGLKSRTAAPPSASPAAAAGVAPTQVMAPEEIDATLVSSDSAQETLIEPAASPAPSAAATHSRTLPHGRRRPPAWFIVAASVGAVLLAAFATGGVLLSLRTKIGTIVVEIDQPELAGAEVSVDGEKKSPLRQAPTRTRSRSRPTRKSTS